LEPAFVVSFSLLGHISVEAAMWVILKRVKLRTAEMLGLDRMNHKFKILAINYIFLMVYYTLESVFVNTLLYRISPEMSIVIYFRAVVYLITGLSVNLAAYIAKTHSPVIVLKLGGLSYALMYVVLFIGMDYMDKLKYIVAVFSGMGMGFYWSGHNILLTHYTDRINRGVGVSIMGLIQGVMTLLLPVFSGFVISHMQGNSGYRVMFGLGMLSVLLQRRMQNKLPPVEQKKRRSDLRLAIKLVVHKTTCKLMLGYEALRGFRDGTFIFFLNTLLFKIITDESLVGINTFVTGMAAILGSWAYGKLAVPGKRIRYAAISTTILLAVGALLFWKANAFTVMLFSVINAFFNLFLVYTANTFSFDVMGQNETTRQCLPEMSAIREVFMNGGRLLGLYVVMLFPDTVPGYVSAMTVLTLSQFLMVMMMNYTKNTMDRKQIHRMSAH